MAPIPNLNPTPSHPIPSRPSPSPNHHPSPNLHPNPNRRPNLPIRHYASRIHG